MKMLHNLYNPSPAVVHFRLFPLFWNILRNQSLCTSMVLPYYTLLEVVSDSERVEVFQRFAVLPNDLEMSIFYSHCVYMGSIFLHPYQTGCSKSKVDFAELMSS